MQPRAAFVIGTVATALAIVACGQVQAVPSAAEAGQTADAEVPALVDATVDPLIDSGGASPVDGAPIALPPVAPPSFAPPGGNFDTIQCVGITCLPGGTIHYTVDGTDPTPSSPVYTTAIAIEGVTTVRAIVVTDHGNSVVSEALINVHVAADPPFAYPQPASGQYPGAVDVKLVGGYQPGTICFTLDGNAPTCSAPSGLCGEISPPPKCLTGVEYTSPVHIASPDGGGSVTLKTISCANGSINSEIVSATYSF